MNKLLITFGCSWTEGVGAGYGKEYCTKNEKEFKLKCWDHSLNTQYSYRTLLCKKYNLENVNFSKGGSSNQAQFRLSEEFFTSKEFEDMHKKYVDGIYVLWAITSTSRGEFYSNKEKKFKSIFYAANSNKNNLEYELSSLIGSNFYDQKVEIDILNNRMKHWNRYFNALSIKNIWIDTFNHHRYLDPVENLCFKNDIPRDLLSKITNTKFYHYHASNWKDDCVLLKPAIEHGLLNPYSMHPTAKGHAIIADILSPEIENLLGLDKK